MVRPGLQQLVHHSRYDTSLWGFSQNRCLPVSVTHLTLSVLSDRPLHPLLL